MPNITEEKWIEMLEKKADGTYIVKYPKVKSKSGMTFDAHLAEDAVGTHNAGNISFTPPEGMVATNLQEAVEEVFTLGNNVKSDTVGALLSVDENLPITENSSWNDIINAIGQIYVGKKYATGLTGTDASGYFEVSGLAFKPAIVIVRAFLSSIPYYLNRYYNVVKYVKADLGFTDYLKEIDGSRQYPDSESSPTVMTDTPLTIIDDGFYIDFSQGAGEAYNDIRWIAIGA